MENRQPRTIVQKLLPEMIRNMLATPKLGIIFLLGFSSGLPLALTGSALEARYASAGVDILTIGIITLCGSPYTYKFLWAPLMDKIVPFSLGRRRSWMLICQISLMIFLMATGLFNAGESPWILATLALVIAFLSASQDVVIDAYRTEILEPRERGIGSAYNVAAYRIAMLVSGSFGFIMADHIGWQLTYMIMACCMLVGVVATLLAKEPSDAVALPDSYLGAYVEPFKEFMSRENAILLLLLVFLFKFGDAFAARMMTTFFIQGLHFTQTEIGTVFKLGGFAATLAGIFVGGVILSRAKSFFKVLLFFGLMQAFSNCMFVLLAAVGHNMPLFIATVSIENFCSGMGTAGFLAFLMALCDMRYTAVQYALLSALSAIPREFLGPLAAFLIKWYDWQMFYLITFIASFPAIVLLVMIRKQLPGMDNNDVSDDEGDLCATSQ